MNSHRIRLRRPWQREGVVEDAVWSRRFGRPSGLGSNESVWLCLEGNWPSGFVKLNGRTLGRLSDAGMGGRYDVTERLLPRNELQIVLRSAASVEVADEPPGEGVLEIRSLGRCEGRHDHSPGP